jgi:hypothetical protein
MRSHPPAPSIYTRCQLVEAYRVQNALTQYHNCQQFGHVWANCEQPPCCLWCGGGHLHKECPEKGNTSSTPACCNCRLSEGEKPHPANYRGCRHAKEELQKKKSQRTPKTTVGRVFSSALTTARVSFAAALWGSREQQQRPQARQVPVTVPTAAEQLRVTATVQQQEIGQSVQASPLDNIVESRNYSTADYDRVQWCCVGRGQNSDRYQNCLKSHEE